MDDKRSFLRDHKFTAVDNLIFFGLSPLISVPMFFGLIWLMGQVIGVAAATDAVVMLVILAFLLSAASGMSVSLALVKRMAQRRARSK